MKTLREYLAEHPPPGEFRPVPHLNVDGAMIQWYWEDVPCHSESVLCDGKWVGTLHRANDDNRVVGVDVHVEEVRGGLFLMEYIGAMQGKDEYLLVTDKGMVPQDHPGE